jgi:SAM-dependent methyltransferase
MLAKDGWQVVGLDFAPQALALASERLSTECDQANLVCGDARILPFENNTFDLVTSTGLLEHFACPEQIVREMVRVLKPEGIFYSDIVPAKFSLLRSLDGFRLGRRPKEGQSEVFERSFSTLEIQRLLTESCLTDVSVIASGILPPQKVFSRRLPLVYRAEYPVTKAFSFISSRLDGTWIAELAGFYYFAWGVKP